MNEQFEKLFVRTSNIVPPRLPAWQGEELANIQITREEVKTVLQALKPTAPGPDGIHPVVLRSCAPCLSKPLTMIFQQSIKNGIVPTDWKRANVTPIYKKGCKSDALNYRPISLTSVACKVLERLVRKHVITHLESSNYLSKQQHGFRSGMSCLTQLLEYLCDVEDAIDEGTSIDTIYLDYSKAFDSVPHCHLLAKLHAAGVHGQLYNWIRDFLTGRKQRVCIQDVCSSWRPVWSGVPQGSVIGPTLILLYVNYLLDGLQSDGKLFADDAKIYRQIKGIEDRQQLQDDLDKLQDWSSMWLLKFNESKCKVVNFGTNNPKYGYRLGGVELAHSEQEKDLGVIITSDLKPSAQVAKAAAAANSMLGRIRKTFTCLNAETLPLLYKALVRPRLEYAIQARSPYLKKDILMLEKIQRRATKLIPSLSHMPYEERIKALSNNARGKKNSRGLDRNI